VKKIIFILTIINFLICFNAYAVEEKQLVAGIYISDSPDETYDTKSKREFVRGETAYCTFFARDFEQDSEENVNITANVEVFLPDGGTLFEENNVTGTHRKILYEQDVIRLDDAFDITFEDEDQVGMYTVKLNISDKVSNLEATSEMTILLFSSQKSKKLIMTRVKDAKHLDDLWAQYFETNHPWAVKGIISALAYRENKGEINTVLIASAAEWSLKSNAVQYSDVYDICKLALKETKGVTKEILTRVIEEVDERKRTGGDSSFKMQ
jgi:hypothetical protein